MIQVQQQTAEKTQDKEGPQQLQHVDVVINQGINNSTLNASQTHKYISKSSNTSLLSAPSNSSNPPPSQHPDNPILDPQGAAGPSNDQPDANSVQNGQVNQPPTDVENKEALDNAGKMRGTLQFMSLVYSLVYYLQSTLRLT